MADLELRQRDREASASCDVDAQARLLAARARVGDIAEWALDLAIQLDHPAALLWSGCPGFPKEELVVEGKLIMGTACRDFRTHHPATRVPSGLITGAQRLQVELVVRAIANLPPSPTWRRFAAGLTATSLAIAVNESVYCHPRHEASLHDQEDLKQQVGTALAQCVLWLADEKDRPWPGRLLPNGQPLLVWRTLALCSGTSVTVSEFNLLEVMLIACGYLGQPQVMEILRETVATWALKFDRRNLASRLPNSPTPIKNIRLGRITITSGDSQEAP